MKLAEGSMCMCVCMYVVGGPTKVTLHSEAALQGQGLNGEQSSYAGQGHPSRLAHRCQSLHPGHGTGECTEITCYQLQTLPYPVA